MVYLLVARFFSFLSRKQTHALSLCAQMKSREDYFFCSSVVAFFFHFFFSFFFRLLVASSSPPLLPLERLLPPLSLSLFFFSSLSLSLCCCLLLFVGVGVATKKKKAFSFFHHHAHARFLRVLVYCRRRCSSILSLVVVGARVLARSGRSSVGEH